MTEQIAVIKSPKMAWMGEVVTNQDLKLDKYGNSTLRIDGFLV